MLKRLKQLLLQIPPRHTMALFFGIWLLFAFFGLGKTANTYYINFIPPWTRSSKGELNFWLGSLLLLFPGAALLGFALSGLLQHPLRWLARPFAAMGKRPFLLTLCGVALFGVGILFLAQKTVLLGQAITDDEHAIRFGGRCIAQGGFSAELTIPKSTLPHLFLYIKGGMVTSFDWLGGQLAWALAEVTQLGGFLFSLVAMLPVLLIGLLFSRKLGKGWGLTGAVMLLFSPMFFTLGMTTHTMVISRSLIALSIFLYEKADEGTNFWLWFFTGLTIGLAFLTRPFESGFLLLPFALYTLYKLVYWRSGHWSMLLGLLLGLAGPLLLFAYHNHALTGSFLKPVRIAVREQTLKRFRQGTFWTRFGANSSYNLFQLHLWFLGPLGLLLVFLGALRNKLTVLLTFSLLSSLVLAMFHDDHGLHIVGPIHYSETLFPLAVIALFGAHRLLELLRRLSPAEEVWAAGLLFTVILSMGLFLYKHLDAMNRSARVQRRIYRQIERQAPKGSVILAPQFAKVWLKTRKMGLRASWVFEWRRPKPDFSDERLILHYRRRHVKRLQERFPERTLFRLRPLKGYPYLKLIPITP